MSTETKDLATLARRVSRKDPAAAVQMLDKLDAGLVHLVRYVLRNRKATIPLHWTILAELDRVPGGGRNLPRDEENKLVEAVARRVSAAEVERHWSGKPHSLTADERGCDTVFT
jgi:hypothetical protein